MLQKAIIEKKIDKYSMKVRIPVYNKIKSDPTATPTEELYTAIIQTLPGCSPVYQEGDLVLVEFENDNISLPVIIALVLSVAFVAMLLVTVFTLLSIKRAEMKARKVIDIPPSAMRDEPKIAIPENLYCLSTKKSDSKVYADNPAHVIKAILSIATL